MFTKDNFKILILHNCIQQNERRESGKGGFFL